MEPKGLTPYSYPLQQQGTIAQHRLENSRSSKIQATANVLLSSLCDGRLQEAQHTLRIELINDECYKEALGKRYFAIAKAMLSTGAFPSASFELILIDPNKRDFAKSWLDLITDPLDKFIQSLRFKDFELIRKTYEQIIKQLEARPALEKLKSLFSNPQGYENAFYEAWKAACSSQLSFVKFLVEKGLDPCHVDKEGNNAFHKAVGSEKWEICEYLLSLKKVNVNQYNQRGNTPLKECILRIQAKSSPNLEKIAHVLVKAGAIIDQEDACFLWKRYSHLSFMRSKLLEEHFEHILPSLSESRSEGTLKLFNQDKSSQILPSQLVTIWETICRTKNLALFEVLKKSDLRQALLSLKDAQGNTSMHIAAYFQASEFLRYLVDLKSKDINQSNHQGLTPLETYLENIKKATPEHLDTITYILKKGGKLNGEDTLKVFKECCHFDDILQIEVLMTCQTVILERHGKASFLHLAVQALAVKSLRFLLKCRAWDLELKDEQQETALFKLSYVDLKEDASLEILKILLTAGANAHLMGEKGYYFTVEIFKTLWQSHLQQHALEYTRREDFITSSKTRTNKEIAFQRAWNNNYHELMLKYINLLKDFRVDLTPLKNYFEQNYWEESFRIPPPVGGSVSYTETHRYGSMVEKVTTTIHTPPISGYWIKNRKHYLKDLLENTYQGIVEGLQPSL